MVECNAKLFHAVSNVILRQWERQKWIESWKNQKSQKNLDYQKNDDESKTYTQLQF
jgi:hypothetical protein